MSYRNNKRSDQRTKFRLVFIVSSIVLLSAVITSVALMAPLPGAIFTTDVNCNGTDLNIYSSKDAVYLDGGPAHPGAAGLADGEYYVQVTTPDGTVLGTSIGAADETPVTVVGGEFQSCYRSE